MLVGVWAIVENGGSGSEESASEAACGEGRGYDNSRRYNRFLRSAVRMGRPHKVFMRKTQFCSARESPADLEGGFLKWAPSLWDVSSSSDHVFPQN